MAMNELGVKLDITGATFYINGKDRYGHYTDIARFGYFRRAKNISYAVDYFARMLVRDCRYANDIDDCYVEVEGAVVFNGVRHKIRRYTYENDIMFPICVKKIRKMIVKSPYYNVDKNLLKSLMMKYKKRMLRAERKRLEERSKKIVEDIYKANGKLKDISKKLEQNRKEAGLKNK